MRKAYLRFAKVISPLMIAGLRAYSLVTRRPRARVVLMNERAEVLLMKGVIAHNDHWTLPGGGVGFRESSLHAALREVHEETGIRLATGDLTFVRRVEKPEFGLPFAADVFTGRCAAGALPDTIHNPYEVAAIEWFPVASLPPDTGRLARKLVREVSAD